MMKPRHNLQRKRHKTVVDYYDHSLDDFRIVIVSPSPSLTSCEKYVLTTSFWGDSWEKIVEMNDKYF